MKNRIKVKPVEVDSITEFYNEDGAYSSVLSPTNIIDTMPISNVPLNSVPSHPLQNHAQEVHTETPKITMNRYAIMATEARGLSTSASTSSLTALMLTEVPLPEIEPQTRDEGSQLERKLQQTRRHSTPVFAPRGETNTTTTAAVSTTTTTSVSSESTRFVRRKPHAEVYGFVLWVSTIIGWLVYIVWAFFPAEVLHAIGFTYFPDRYWALALPSFLIMAHVFYNVVFNALIFMKIKPLDSNYTYTDEFAAKQKQRSAVSGGQHRKRSIVASDVNDNANQKEDMLFDGKEGIPPIMDIPITVVNKLLYQAAPQPQPSSSASSSTARRFSWVPTQSVS